MGRICDLVVIEKETEKASMSSKVWYASARVKKWKYSDSMAGRLEAMLRSVDLGAHIEGGEWVAIKTHLGSDGAHRTVRPLFLRKVVEAVKCAGAKPFITDTVRIKGLDYLEVANANGINHLSTGAPVVLADGLYGHDNLMVKAGDILGEVAVSSVIHDVPAMVMTSHVKGHILAGIGATMKNLAMGGVSGGHRTCGWKCGRGAMHTKDAGAILWEAGLCTQCYQCEEVCPLECITFKDDRTEFTYDANVCWRCGRCTRVCPSGALSMEGADDTRFLRGLAEAAMAVLSTFKPGKVLYINFMTEMQPECDCMPGADVPVMQDQGIMASWDPVAVEQATLDMILKASPLPQSAAEDKGIKAGEDIFTRLSGRNLQVTIDEAERLGLGSKDYRIAVIEG